MPGVRPIRWRCGISWALHKAEHAIDLETGAIVGATVQGADHGDTTTIQQTLPEAAEQLEAVAAVTDHTVKVVEEVVADKGYHSRTTVHDLEMLEIRTYISEPDRGSSSSTSDIFDVCFEPGSHHRVLSKKWPNCAPVYRPRGGRCRVLACHLCGPCVPRLSLPLFRQNLSPAFSDM